jgi:hypothetical protein
MKINDTVRILRYGTAPRNTLRKEGVVTDVFTDEGNDYAVVRLFETDEEYSYNIVKLKLIGETKANHVDVGAGSYVKSETMSKLGIQQETSIRFIL